MDWEANLAAIIKCTDDSLAQQFRQFEDVTAEFTAVDETSVRSGGHDPNENVATTYLRETMAAEHNRQHEKHQQQPRASYSRVSSAFARGSAPSTTFSEHFHRRQERKRTAVGIARDNQRLHRRGNEYEPAEDEGQQDDNEPRYATSRQPGSAYQQQMYSSPSYDVAQMMEQVRLSLKLEVDARAAIAERQLSALLQLCKASSEELDRLRVEVCANDRQLHTLDQVQSKIRQELTTQKDIGFHLQSMVGKDESWRMQTENQLLELRQMVAALREQGNSTQAVAQEKLSRSELLVQFNAAMEPIKAQLQANLQHQAQQIADITRTTSSSSLLLDGITQKVNRGMTEELSELRSDLNALKHHVAKLDIFQDGGKRESCAPQPTKEEQEAKVKEEQQQQENKLTALREELQKELLALVKDYVKGHIKPIRQAVEEHGMKYASKNDVENMRSALEEGCRNRYATAVMQVDSQIKSTQDQLRGECSAAVRDCFYRTEKSVLQATNAMASACEGRVSSWQNKHTDLVKLVEKEEKERKQVLEELRESIRKNRHQLEDQLHALIHENRTKLSLHDGDFDKRLKKQIESAMVYVQKETQTALANFKDSFQTQGNSNTVELEQRLKRLEETVSRTDQSVDTLSKSIASLPPANPPPASDASAKNVSLALEKQASVYVSTMENLFQKMQLQLQMQTQPQVQMVAPSPYHGFWPPSPYAPSQTPPPPLLHLPASFSTAATTTPTMSTPSAATASVPISCSTQDNFENKPENDIKEKSDDLVRSAVPVPATVNSPSPLSSPPPVALTPKLVSDQSELHCPGEDTPINRVNTLATTAKGALAEAELAKARVENRRKIELEMKQQHQKRPPNSAEPGASGSNLSDAAETGNHRLSVPAVATAQPPVLTRSASSSTLPGHNIVGPVGKQPFTPASVPSTPTTARLPPGIPPATIPPQSNRAEGVTGVSMVPSFTALSQSNVQVESKPPSINPVVTSIPPADPKLPAVLPTPRASTPSELQPNNTRPDLTISVPATDEVKPSLSPLAKMFARSTPAEVKDDLSPAPIANISSTVKNLAPTTSSPEIEAPVSHVLCGLCRLPVRSDLMTQHEKEMCPKRMIECASCKQQLQWVNLEIHELECSAAQRRRTETAISTEAKPLSDGSTATALDLEGSLKRCRHCSADIQSLDLLEHEMNCDKVLKQCPHCLRRQKMSELQDHIENCDCRLVSCPNDCGGKFLQRGIPNHLATRCPKKPATTSATPSNIETTKPPPPPSTLLSNGKVECKFCDDEIEANEVEDHEINCDWKPKRCQHCNMVVISRDLLRHETSCKTNVKSCPHCNETMPQSALTTHVSRCSKRPIKCIRCCQLFPADTIVAHSTNCKFAPGTSSGAGIASPQPIATTSRATIKIPPPPPFPPPCSVTTPVSTPVSTPQHTRRSSADSPAKDEAALDRLARRNLALSQLTNPSMTPSSSSRASAPSLQPSSLQSRPTIQPDGRGIEAGEDEEDNDEEYEDEDDEQLTLAQVVKEWSVENVCLWLHEDVGVPGVVLRFQQKQCNGEMLLELTESDLINDFGVKDRVQRERILSAIEAINTSNAFSDEDEDDDENEVSDEEDLEESEGYEATNSSTIRHSIGAAPIGHPRDILRRPPQPSPRRVLGGDLPSSNDMLRRISTVLENPKR